jgi:very-short-patch-repair endonuclease
LSTPKKPRDFKSFHALPFNPALLPFAARLRKAGNLSEVLLWQQLRNGKLHGLDFDRQKVICNYIVDFFCAQRGVVIEVDGQSHDLKEEQDAERDEKLCELGLVVIRLAAQDVLKELPRVMDTLRVHPDLQ